MEHVLVHYWVEMGHSTYHKRGTYELSMWRLDETIKKILLMVTVAIFWSIWNERNRRCFDAFSAPEHSLTTRCLVLLFCWTKLANLSSSEQLMEFIGPLVLY